MHNYIERTQLYLVVSVAQVSACVAHAPRCPAARTLRTCYQVAEQRMIMTVESSVSRERLSDTEGLSLTTTAVDALATINWL